MRKTSRRDSYDPNEWGYTMSKKWQHSLWLAAVAGALGLVAAASAQNAPFQPFKNLFASRSASDSKGFDARTLEIQVELAWLADPATFPYFLEAHIKGANLEVRGYVPSKAVRDQALNLAKIQCPMPVVDSLKEHTSLAVRPVQRTPEQLKTAVQTALREAFPGVNLVA